MTASLRFLALDLDGTLLDDQKCVSDRNFRALQALLARGVCITVASARDCTSILQVVPIVHPNLYYIANGGALVYAPHTEQILWADNISPELVAESVAFLQQYGYPVFLNDINEYWVDQINDRVTMIEERYLLHVTLFSDTNHVKRVMRVSLSAPIVVLRQAAEHAQHIFKNRLTVSLASPDWLDLMPAGAGKGALLEILQNRLGISVEQTMAIGDFESDVPLFSRARIRIAMGNATSLVKEAATDLTSTNNQDGVAAAIEKYFPPAAQEG